MVLKAKGIVLNCLLWTEELNLVDLIRHLKCMLCCRKLFYLNSLQKMLEIWNDSLPILLLHYCMDHSQHCLSLYLYQHSPTYATETALHERRNSLVHCSLITSKALTWSLIQRIKDYQIISSIIGVHCYLVRYCDYLYLEIPKWKYGYDGRGMLNRIETGKMKVKTGSKSLKVWNDIDEMKRLLFKHQES